MSVVSVEPTSIEPARIFGETVFFGRSPVTGTESTE